eukprot:3176933-Ditylum_brightwellii.AAC.1
MNQDLIHPEMLPPWITGGVTTLLYEKGNAPVPNNYLLITCLPTCYTLLTILNTIRMYDHLI